MSESKEAEKPAPQDLLREKAGIELRKAQRTCWRKIPWRESTRMFDSDRATEASMRFALTLFDERADGVLRRESDYEVFKSELDATAANIVAELQQEWRTFSPRGFDEAHVGLTVTCIPAVRRALVENQETWRLRFLDTQIKRMDKEPLEELRALGLTVPITEEVARKLWAALLRIDGDARRIGPSDPITPVRAAYQAIASGVVNYATPDQVLEEMIPQAILSFHSTRPWARYQSMEHLNLALAPSVIEWKATRLEMTPPLPENAPSAQPQTGSEPLASAASANAEPAIGQAVGPDDEGPPMDPVEMSGAISQADLLEDGYPISITTNRKLIFLEFHGGRTWVADIGGPRIAPGWIRNTETFKHGIQGDKPVITVHPSAADQSDPPARLNPLPAFSNSGTPEFWRGLRSAFRALVTEQRNLGLTETHERWLRGSCFYPPGYEDLSRCRIRTAINGQIVSEFQDLATQGAYQLGCPSEVEPVGFWLYCLVRNLFESDRRELRSEILGDPESGGIVHDLAGSCIGFCSRLATESERSVRTQPRPHTEGNPPESAPHHGESEMDATAGSDVLGNATQTHGEAAHENAKAVRTAPAETVLSPDQSVSPNSAAPVDQSADQSIAVELAGLLQKIADQKNITIETWAKDHGFGRSTVFDWKTCRSKGLPLTGKVSADKAAAIETAIDTDAAVLGLITRTGSD
jgi:hypothetical protein